MIIATGIDIVELERIAQSIQRFGDRFLRRVFTDREIAYCQKQRKPARNFAARFAAKEAVLKCLRERIRVATWHEIEIIRNETGAPSVDLTGNTAQAAADLGISRIHLSLSHSDDYAIATAIAERD